MRELMAPLRSRVSVEELHRQISAIEEREFLPQRVRVMIVAPIFLISPARLRMSLVSPE